MEHLGRVKFIIIIIIINRPKNPRFIFTISLFLITVFSRKI
jgi:hypothetical protein